MEIKLEAILLTAESKAYEFSGNKGVSHKIRLSIKGEIYSCKSTEDQVKSLARKVGESGDAVVKIVSRKEALSLELVSFEN